jgi:Flp pilus assembly protein TadB
VRKIPFPPKFCYDPNEPNFFFFFFFNHFLSLSLSLFFEMMQRSSTSNSRSSTEDHRAINIATEPQQQNAKRRRNPDDDSLDALPLYHHRTVAGRREVSRSRSPPVDKMIHAIPMLVLLCIFTLWWFSFPGTYFSRAFVHLIFHALFLFVLSFFMLPN